MPLTYAIGIGPWRPARLWVASARHPDVGARGWREYVWTKNKARAEQFDTPEAAEKFAAEKLPQSLGGRVVGIFWPSRTGPTGRAGRA